ncbi:acyltransferase family protein [Massilia sp. TS11]|uniref:acyltransferase family protein n=1 Tax=Massilia sp. TS11 TaxID=2908003 RepID=UPI001ED9CEAE|nr:acyltransferase family protein [Massilia sp. TS11]MCG2583257.1 acyltransferase family protein [Massilia sp. TS11]
MNTQRLYFLDWVRIFAFFLLIAYHTGMYYVSWDWHVKSPFASDALEPLMMLSSPWRLGLLFLVSGVAARCLLHKLSAARFMAKRSLRLLLPLAFGMAVVVPPQPYLEVVEKVAYAGSYGDFLRLYFSAYHGFCRGSDCLTLPTWNHLWFVAYLWVYCMLFGALGLLATSRLAAWGARLAGWLQGWRMLVLPWAALALARIALVGAYPSTHDLVHDWYNHAQYGLLFMLGALLATEARAWQSMAELRWPALGTALTCWAALVIYFSIPEALIKDVPDTVRAIQRAVYALCAWSAIVAACGFARTHLNVDSPRRRYLTEAVFPVYIAHQTLIVVIAHALKPVRLAPCIEGVVIMVLTLGLSFALFALVRRIPLLRACFGLGAPAV